MVLRRPLSSPLHLQQSCWNQGTSYGVRLLPCGIFYTIMTIVV
eukprot:COSAG02_NODE_354_length_24016_cov_208.299231_10_plen_43_part_00